MEDNSLAFGCWEFGQSFDNGAFGPGLDEAKKIILSIKWFEKRWSKKKN